MSNNTKKSLAGAVDELTRAREEVRLGLHLLSMEAKEQWNGLESKIREIDDDLRTQGEEVGEKSAAKVQEMARSVREFVEKTVRNIGERRP